MSYQPAENLNNRNFIGLIIAQFLAGFNDQAIHAAAMFYAIHTRILSQENAITLMPVLFYAPWAIFCTLSGYYADRFSKTMTLRFWKVAEIVISLIMIAGFYFGGDSDTVKIGGWIVMVCVFLMGTHAAFFAPAKYGAMPEILRSHLLSRGNGILESTTFLASILGTVAGGLLFHLFRDNEIWIGVILLVLSVIGAAASFLIAWLPAASPERPFPTNPIKPLVENLKVMFRSRPLALAVLGIAFFVFMVAYMRASMYMHGESRNPRWDEEKTSLIVATVALGVGLGSPLAGYLSGGKVELGLVPLGCLGMIVALIAAAVAIDHTAVLVVALIVIGFFSGFYMVPLYTLLQQRAPKKSKGELVATSNFINVTGAIAASLLFNVLVQFSRLINVTPEIELTTAAVGIIQQPIVLDEHGKIESVVIKMKDGTETEFDAESTKGKRVRDAANILAAEIGEETKEVSVIDFDDQFFDVLSGTPKQGDEVVVSSYVQGTRQHFRIRKADQLPRKVYDNEILPRYLFIAALMTVAILFILRRKLPDFYVRSLFWFKSLGRYRLKAVGMHNLPTEGPVILATNCKDMRSCLQLVSATDRSTKVVLVDTGAGFPDGELLRQMALYFSLILVDAGPNNAASWQHAKRKAERTLRGGHLLAVSVENDAQAGAIAEFLADLRRATGAPLLPVYCGSLDDGVSGITPRIRVVFGEMMTAEGDRDSRRAAASAGHSDRTKLTSALDTIHECKNAIEQLGVWIRANDDHAGAEHH